KASTIIGVEYSIGRMGTITPVAKLKPLNIGGVVVTSASLHNFDEVKRLGVKIGDDVFVERAGDVIPKVVGLKSPGKNRIEIEVPKKCPICGSSVVKEETEVDYYCSNRKCPAVVKKSILFFASRDAMNIEGMGESIVEELYNRNLVKKVSDIYKLKKEDLLKLPLFKEKKATKLLNSIEKSKNSGLIKLIYGLGIKHVGLRAAELLAERFKDIDAIIKAKKNELLEIEGFGEEVANSIINFFSDKENLEVINELKNSGVKTKLEKETKSGKLKGMVFVFTGELDSMTRSNAEKIIKELAGEVAKTVSKRVNIIVVGKNPGSKLDKAKKLGIKIINEEEFLKLIK
ncbi:MAG: NAD-dependent DNA ligase LigA, partial [bacterium]|nr:NAD-dependent DNA ligase LigA [bacterium]